MNPQGNEWHLLYLQNTKIALRAKVLLSRPITIWFRNLFPCLERWKFWMQKQQRTRNGRSWRQFQPGSWEKVKSKKEVIFRSTKRQKSPLWYTDGHLSPQERRVRTKTTKYKGRVVLRGETVNGGSGACAVFTEQGSSASQQDCLIATDKQPTQYQLTLK